MRARGRAILHFPGFMLAAFFLLPLAVMLVVSFFHRTASWYEPGFEFTHYARLLSPVYLNAFLRSMLYAMISATIAVTLAFPFAYLISRLHARAQVVILVFVLCVLSLSEVIVAFSWSTLLSRSSGISNLLVLVGLMDFPASWARGTTAVLAGLSYYNIPFGVLILYPGCSRFDSELTEAAETMGASPLWAFFTVVVPVLRAPLMSAWVVLFVFSMGSLVTPQWLGNPSDWMIANHIDEEIMNRGNVPFGAAMAMIYLLITACLLSLLRLATRREEKRQ